MSLVYLLSEYWRSSTDTPKPLAVRAPVPGRTLH